MCVVVNFAILVPPQERGEGAVPPQGGGGEGGC